MFLQIVFFLVGDAMLYTSFYSPVTLYVTKALVHVHSTLYMTTMTNEINPFKASFFSDFQIEKFKSVQSVCL